MSNGTSFGAMSVDGNVFGLQQGNGNVQNFHFPAKGFQKPYLTKRSVADFTGREEKIAQITACLTGQTDRKAVTISAVSGMGGVGKTSLVRHVAGLLADQFPDGQLYGDLRGQDDRPVAPVTILLEWLRLFGYEESELPMTLDGLAGWLRCCVADKRILIIIDNAHDERQVEPLLPGNGACGVMITSREWLKLDGVSSIELDVMSEAESLTLLGQIIGEAVVEQSREASKKLMKLCGYLPLAIRITGASLCQKLANPKWGWTVEKQVAALADESFRLGEFKGKYRSIEACFQLSYRDLSIEDRRLFSALGVLRGKDFGVPLATVMNRDNPDGTSEGLERLEAMQLLEIASDDRYSFHDLVRLFARGKLKSEVQTTLAIKSLGWFEENSQIYHTLLIPKSRRPIAEKHANENEMSLEAIEKTLYEMAMEWFLTESSNFIDVIKWAQNLGEHQTTVNLAGNLASFFRLTNFWNDWVMTYEVALLSTKMIGNTQSTAQIIGHLGYVYTDQWKLEMAIDCFQQSIEIYREIGDNKGLGNSMMGLENIYQNQGKWEEAIDCYQQSLEILRLIDDQEGVSHTIGNLGNLYNSQGRWEEAIDCHQQTLERHREFGETQEVATTLGNLGNAYSSQGKDEKAIDCYQKSLEICREFGNQHGIAKTTVNLGIVYNSQGKWKEAIDCCQQSLEIYREFGDQCGVASTNMSLGNVYYYQGKYKKAIDCYQPSLETFRTIGDIYSEAAAWNNLGNAQVNLDNSASRNSYQNAKAIFQKLNLTDRVDNCDNLISQIDQLIRPATLLKSSTTSDSLSSQQDQLPTSRDDRSSSLWSAIAKLLSASVGPILGISIVALVIASNFNWLDGVPQDQEIAAKSTILKTYPTFEEDFQQIVKNKKPDFIGMYGYKFSQSGEKDVIFVTYSASGSGFWESLFMNTTTTISFKVKVNLLDGSVTPAN